MKRLRLVFVTRRFWPLVGGEATSLANLTAELRQMGTQPSVVTAQWDHHWPTNVVCQEVPIRRLAFPRHRPWGAMRYMIAVSRWLRDNAASFDLVCLSALGHESAAAISTMKKAGKPVVVRVGTSSIQEARRISSAGFAQRLFHRGHMADLFIAVDPQAQRELLESGLEPNQVRLIPHGVRTDIAAKPADRRLARTALAEANVDLHASEQAPVGLFIGDLRRGNGLDNLITAWSLVVRRRPDARLWLVGDGPDRGRLFRHIQDSDLVGRVMMPGCFDAQQELFQAADLAIASSGSSASIPFILSAMAARLPVITVDSPSARTTVTPGETGTLVPPDFPNIWADAMIKIIENPQSVAGMIGNAMQMVRKYYPLEQMAKAHLNVFQELISKMSARS
jgi:glycosyltransferase involved in cell wall biosynthesis